MRNNNIFLSEEWFLLEYFPRLEQTYSIKYLEEPGDFGLLRGVQFESTSKGGYLYFWENGFVGLLLVDYGKGESIIEDGLFDNIDLARNKLEKLVGCL